MAWIRIPQLVKRSIKSEVPRRELGVPWELAAVAAPLLAVGSLFLLSEKAIESVAAAIISLAAAMLLSFGAKPNPPGWRWAVLVSRTLVMAVAGIETVFAIAVAAGFA